MQVDYSSFTDYQGSNPVKDYQPQILTSYNSLEPFREVVELFNSWQMKSAFQKINNVLSNPLEKSDYLTALRIAGELLAIYNDLDQASTCWEEILKVIKNDQQALCHLYFYALAQDKTNDQKVYLDSLKNNHPKLYQEVSILSEFIKQNISPSSLAKVKDMENIEAIVINGTAADDNGQPSKKLLRRLEAGLELAKKYPNAKIIVSGAAVKNQFKESDVMAKWLNNQGVSAERLIKEPLAKDTVGNAIGVGEILKDDKLEKICLISSRYHLPRSYINLSLVLNGFRCKIVAYSNQKDHSQVSQAEESQIYINAMRCKPLFTYQDFDY